MSTFEQYQSKLLEKHRQDIVFIELKEDRHWLINQFKWEPMIPIPVFFHDLADRVKKQDIETIPLVAIIKGLVYTLGIADSSLPHLDFYRKALLEIDNDVDERILSDALRHANMSQYFESMILLSALTQLRPDQHLPYFYLGRCYYDLAVKDEHAAYYKAATHCFEKVNAMIADFALSYYYLGFCYYNQAMYINAEAAWVEALKMTLDEEQRIEIVQSLGRIRDKADFERGVQYILSERFDEGLQCLLPLEMEHDEWWELNFYIGLGYRFLEQYEDALSYFLKAIDLNTGHIQSINELGICYMNIGDYSAALMQYKEALRLSPQNAELICNKGIVYYLMGDMKEAKALFLEANAIAPDDELIQRWLMSVDERNQLH